MSERLYPTLIADSSLTIGEAIDLFKHTLDKTALVWFQTNRSKFKDLTMLKMMFLQRYNPWEKTKKEQLQSWNILS